jgi:hypothetical protein
MGQAGKCEFVLQVARPAPTPSAQAAVVVSPCICPLCQQHPRVFRLPGAEISAAVPAYTTVPRPDAAPIHCSNRLALETLAEQLRVWGRMAGQVWGAVCTESV